MSSAIDAQKTSMTGCIPQWPPFRAFNNLLHSILKSCSQRGENKNLRGEVSSLWSYQNVSLEQFVSVNHDVWMRFSKFFSIFCKILSLDWQIKPQIRRFCQSWVNISRIENYWLLLAQMTNDHHLQLLRCVDVGISNILFDHSVNVC